MLLTCMFTYVADLKINLTGKEESRCSSLDCFHPRALIDNYQSNRATDAHGGWGAVGGGDSETLSRLLMLQWKSFSRNPLQKLRPLAGLLTAVCPSSSVCELFPFQLHAEGPQYEECSPEQRGHI